MNSNKKIARTIGALFLAGMIIGIVGNILVQSTLTTPDYLSIISGNKIKLTIGALLLFLTSIWDATHGVLMFPILEQRSKHLAIGYLSFRIFDAVFLGLQVLFILLQIPLGSEFLKASAGNTLQLQSVGQLLIKANIYSYQIGMISVGIAGLILCYSFYITRLVPRFVAVWGLVGYSTILGGSVLEVLGFDLFLIHTIPGGLWEVFIGVWLITKGFKPSPITRDTI